MTEWKIQRKRIRKENFDYAKKGSYFITICGFENRPQFGQIKAGLMMYNDLGTIVEDRWKKIPEKFPGVTIGKFVVMPNHFHGILHLAGIREASKGLDVREASKGFDVREASKGLDVREASKGLPYGMASLIINGSGAKAAPSVPRIIHWVKTWTTNEYFRFRKVNHPGIGYLKLWHRSYYDHIIRNQDDYIRISDYIENNPANWEKDRFMWSENL